MVFIQTEDVKKCVKLRRELLMLYIFLAHAISQEINCFPLTAQAGFRSQASLCGICGRQSGIRTGFPRRTSVSLASLTLPTLRTHNSCTYDLRNVILSTDSVVKNNASVRPSRNFLYSALYRILYLTFDRSSNPYPTAQQADAARMPWMMKYFPSWT